MKLLFLDIDGVLNTHQTFSNGYCGIEFELADRFNAVLEARLTGGLVSVTMTKQ